MKKSKLIVPAALAVMLLSTAASVTGTVAWFTVNRAVDTYTGNFSVESVDGNLSLTAAAVTGTTESNGVVSIASGAKMTDASYDASTGNLYRHPYTAAETNALATGHTFVEKTESEANWKRTVTVNTTSTVYYYAVSWTYTFTYVYGSDTNTLNLYLSTDSGKSYFTKESANRNATGDHTEQTWKGFRIAFINSAASTGSTVVWAQQQIGDNVKHIHATNTAETGVAQDSGVKVLASDTAPANTVLETAESGGTSVNNYIGQFTSSVTSITVKCVAWFEGTDPNVINEAEMDTVSAHMRFFVRPHSAS